MSAFSRDLNYADIQIHNLHCERAASSLFKIVETSIFKRKEIQF